MARSPITAANYGQRSRGETEKIDPQGRQNGLRIVRSTSVRDRATSSESDGGADRRAAELDVELEGFVLVIDLEVAIAGECRDRVVELVADAAEHVPGQVRGDAEAADLAHAGKKEAAAEVEARLDADDGIDPVLVVLDLLVIEQAAVDIEAGVDRP